MTSDISKYTPLKRIVSYFLDEYDKNIGDFDKAWGFAFRGFIVMGYSASWEILSVRLPVNGNLTVTIPSDCIMWIKIGVMNNNGEISSIKINNQLSTFRDNNPNRLSDLTPDVNNSWVGGLCNFPYFVNYYGGAGYYTTPIFGLGNGLIQYSECRVDEKNGLINFPPIYLFPNLMLENILCPQKNNFQLEKNRLQEALIAFI